MSHVILSSSFVAVLIMVCNFFMLHVCRARCCRHRTVASVNLSTVAVNMFIVGEVYIGFSYAGSSYMLQCIVCLLMQQ